MGPIARGKKPRAAILIAALACGALVLALAIALAPRPPVDPDLKLAPPYGATALDGAAVTLEQMRGRVVMLNVWATWCSSCLEEMPKLQSLQEEYEARGFTVVGSSIDASGEGANVRAMADSLRVRYPVWLDPEDRATRAFRLIGVPATFLITSDGYVAHEWRGQFDPLSADTKEVVEDALDRGAARPPGGAR